MNPMLPDGEELPLDEVALGRIMATTFFARFKDDLEEFEAQTIEMFAIDKKSDQHKFLASMHFELLCMISVGTINGICGPNTKAGSEKVKLLFNQTFEKISSLLEIFYPSVKFMAYSMEKDSDGKSKNPPESPQSPGPAGDSN